MNVACGFTGEIVDTKLSKLAPAKEEGAEMGGVGEYRVYKELDGKSAPRASGNTAEKR